MNHGDESLPANLVFIGVGRVRNSAVHTAGEAFEAQTGMVPASDFPGPGEMNVE